MEFAYAKATDSYVMGEVANTGTLNATAADEDREGLLEYVSSAAAAVYSASLGFARNIVVSPQQWGKIMNKKVILINQKDLIHNMLLNGNEFTELELTKAKDAIRSILKSTQYRQFKIESSLQYKINGDTIIFE